MASLKSEKQRTHGSASDKMVKPIDNRALPACGTGEEKAGAEVKSAINNGSESLPPKIVAMQRVRWNLNKGSERWLCSGGAAGIVRCQEIGL